MGFPMTESVRAEAHLIFKSHHALFIQIMISNKLLALTLFSLVVVASGCTNAEINRNPEGEITLSGNESQDLTIWVKNNLGETEGFNVEFVTNPSQLSLQ